jgi:hypothetical protein
MTPVLGQAMTPAAGSADGGRFDPGISAGHHEAGTPVINTAAIKVGPFAMADT